MSNPRPETAAVTSMKPEKRSPPACYEPLHPAGPYKALMLYCHHQKEPFIQYLNLYWPDKT